MTEDAKTLIKNQLEPLYKEMFESDSDPEMLSIYKEVFFGYVLPTYMYIGFSGEKNPGIAVVMQNGSKIENENLNKLIEKTCNAGYEIGKILRDEMFKEKNTIPITYLEDVLVDLGQKYHGLNVEEYKKANLRSNLGPLLGMNIEELSSDN